LPKPPSNRIESFQIASHSAPCGVGIFSESGILEEREEIDARLLGHERDSRVCHRHKMISTLENRKQETARKCISFKSQRTPTEEDRPLSHVTPKQSFSSQSRLKAFQMFNLQDWKIFSGVNISNLAEIQRFVFLIHQYGICPPFPSTTV
jgi:hypothetical protein